MLISPERIWVTMAYFTPPRLRMSAMLPPTNTWNGTPHAMTEM